MEFVFSAISGILVKVKVKLITKSVFCQFSLFLHCWTEMKFQLQHFYESGGHNQIRASASAHYSFRVVPNGSAPRIRPPG